MTSLWDHQLRHATSSPPSWRSHTLNAYLTSFSTYFLAIFSLLLDPLKGYIHWSHLTLHIHIPHKPLDGPFNLVHTRETYLIQTGTAVLHIYSTIRRLVYSGNFISCIPYVLLPWSSWCIYHFYTVVTQFPVVFSLYFWEFVMYVRWPYCWKFLF